MLVLSGFLTDAECDFIKKYASHRMVPSGLATMDSTKSEVGVRTSTQTFMERGGTAQIKHLEERAHNLTRLPYELGENIQVVRYEEGQKYGAHRDFFNPNDYHRQPSMLRSVEYGARNRLATVFWYLETVSEGHGGETFFPRALNAEGKEYKPWNGDHEDCYRGIAVPPEARQRGALLLDGTRRPPRREIAPRRLPPAQGARRQGDREVGRQPVDLEPRLRPQPRHLPAPRRKPRAPAGATSGCTDDHDNCEAWAADGECGKNPQFMEEACRSSCGKC